MPMTKELEERIKDLKDQVTALEKQKQVLSDFIDLVPDHAHSIMKSIGDRQYGEATEKLQRLQLSAIATLKEAISYKKSP